MSKNQFAICSVLKILMYATHNGIMSRKICLSNLYCGYYTTKFQFCQEFFRTKVPLFKTGRICINLAYRYTKYPTRFETSPCRAFLKFIFMFPKKVEIGLCYRKLTPPFNIHRVFVKIINLCTLHR